MIQMTPSFMNLQLVKKSVNLKMTNDQEQDLPRKLRQKKTSGVTNRKRNEGE